MKKKINSRRKGKANERELAKRIKSKFPDRSVLRLDQTRGGHYSPDILLGANFWIEAKKYKQENFSLLKCLRKLYRECPTHNGAIPILHFDFTRERYLTPCVVMKTEDVVSCSLDKLGISDLDKDNYLNLSSMLVSQINKMTLTCKKRSVMKTYCNSRSKFLYLKVIDCEVLNNLESNSLTFMKEKTWLNLIGESIKTNPSSQRGLE